MTLQNKLQSMSDTELLELVEDYKEMCKTGYTPHDSKIRQICEEFIGGLIHVSVIGLVAELTLVLADRLKSANNVLYPK